MTDSRQAITELEQKLKISSIELERALAGQTATSEILKLIASSPSDVQPVFDAIAVRANRLIEGLSTGVYSLIEDTLHLSAYTRVSPAADAALKASFPRPLSNFPWGENIRKGEIVHIADIEDEWAEVPSLLELARLRGFRGVLIVPLLQHRSPIGVITVSRAEPGTFATYHVELLQTFSDQAVIAIENVRLFDEVQSRTEELMASLDKLRATQDRLVETEKLASLGQLTAGIAHEIKNPLNFVNNFSSLSAELTDELNEVLKSATLSGQIQQDVNELTRMLKENLAKVIQHGKRADLIVKNMLQHSREGSREHRPEDINTLLDKSLKLAYRGARAENPNFNAVLLRDFDTTIGLIDVFPQEITRVFLNLISNGFYAVTKRKTEDDRSRFEPALSAVTRNLGDTVEIRIRDNGAGIPVEVRKKLFEPFFTTKPTGEGTGLGLSLSYDIVAKLHGGDIKFETELGQFTEFTIVLPRRIIG
jgi:two-component system NtrC family sensor kinase